VLETVTQYVHEQGLCERRVALEEIFAPNTLDLWPRRFDCWFGAGRDV